MGQTFHNMFNNVNISMPYLESPWGFGSLIDEIDVNMSDKMIFWYFHIWPKCKLYTQYVISLLLTIYLC